MKRLSPLFTRFFLLPIGVAALAVLQEMAEYALISLYIGFHRVREQKAFRRAVESHFVAKYALFLPTTSCPARNLVYLNAVSLLL
jgi:hypothetical protein